MHRPNRNPVFGTALMFAAAIASGEVAAQSPAPAYPTKPVRLTVPFPPGSSTDIISRILAQKLTDVWRQQVVVENRAGGGGSIGAELVAKALPDGYTLLIGHIGTHGVNPSLYTRLPYDPIGDFAPVTQTASLPLVLVVHGSLPLQTVAQLVALAKTKPGLVNYASGGNGSAAHLAVEYFKLLAKVDIVHIPYKGTGPALADLVGGQVSLTITGMPPLMPHLNSGRLRGLAVTTIERVPELPSLPTIAESGYPEYEINSWQGMFAPRGTPGALIARLNRDIASALKSADVRERFSVLGAQPVGNSPEQFAKHVKAEIAKWARVVRDTHMSLD